MRAKPFIRQRLGGRILSHLIAMLLSVLMVLPPTAAWAADNQDETVTIDGVSYHVLRTSEDWVRFRNLVQEAAGKSDVNAILDDDFTAIYTIGREQSYAYRGIFNGNGHTLNMEISGAGNSGIALFGWVKDATIQNLHLTGTVNAGLHAAGLVGYFDGSPHVLIDRVWISADITSSSTHVGGFVGHSQDAHVEMNDCRFDGTLAANGSSESYGGAIFGWGHNGSWTLHRVYEAGSYNNIRHAGFSYWMDKAGDGSNKVWGHNSKSSNCRSAHNWGEMADANCRNVTDQDKLLAWMNGEKAGTWQMAEGKAVPVMNTNGLDATFETYDMVPGTETGEEGMLKIPFSCDQAVKWVEVSYTTEDGFYREPGRTTFAKNTYAGFIKVPATEQHRDMTIKAKLLVGSVTVGYDPKSDAVMHAPLQLQAELLSCTENSVTEAGVMELKWITRNPKYNDVVDGDQFTVLRSLTGHMEDLETIGSVPLDSSDSVYTYRDETLISALTQEQIGKGALDVRYCVIRASAQQIWGVDNNPASTIVRSPLDMLHLLRVKDYQAQWEDQTDKTIRVSWEYGDEYGALWDDRARMKLLVSSSNRAGAAVDSATYVLTGDELNGRSKVVQLNRSCVNYKIEVFTERGTSPLPLQVSYFEIRTADDWAAFIEQVKNADGKNVNAMLMNDISVGNSVGTLSAPFQGIFEGNGHTLTCDISWNQQDIAPFRFVGNATIRNLRTAGTISSSVKHQGGLIGSVTSGSTVHVESCRSSVSLVSSVNDDSCVGGFVGTAMNIKQLTFSNCVFDGSFAGADNQRNGGFVGWAYAYDSVAVENCLFAPAKIETGYKECMTWVRTYTPDKVTIINSYCTKEYSPAGVLEGYTVINSTADWDAFASKVADVNFGHDMNAILNADITVTQPIVHFQGVFDGNGHTLNVNIDKDDYYIAPFSYAKNYTIRNLRVTGTISCKGYSSGIVGYDYYLNSDNGTISNCRVSATLKVTNSEHVSGFVGYSHNTDHHIDNCLFDGRLISTNSNSRGAAFVDFGDANYNWISNCLENGSYEGFTNAAMNYSDTDKPYGNNSKCTNNWSYHNWAELNGNVVGAMAVSELVTKLGSDEWQVVDGEAVPILHRNWKAGDVDGKSSDEIIALLGNGWTKDADGKVVPVMADKAQVSIASSVKHPYRIYTAEDWNTFVDMVRTAGNKQDVCATLMADITVTEPVGAEASYRGTFEGGGHTLTVSIDRDEESVAPFKNVIGTTTIRNLNVKGSVKGARHAAGLVGGVDAGATLLVENCHVSCGITTTGDYAGGIIGHGNASHVTVRNCLFDGSMINNRPSNTCFAGAFIGWSEASATHTVENCLENGTYTDFLEVGANYHNDNGGKVWGGTNNWTYKDWEEINQVGQTSTVELAAALGDHWQVKSGRVMPKSAGSQIPGMETFYYENLGKIDKDSLGVQSQQSSVVLMWANVDDEPVDYYEVWRKDLTINGDYKRLATQLTEMQYEDKDVSPVHDYEYFVRGVCSCEGEKYEDTKKVQGHCVQTATISGYFRFTDGTGIPGETIGTQLPDGKQKTVTTNENGYFVFKDLPYVDGKETSYRIAPQLNGFSGYKDITVGTLPGENVVGDVVFEVENSIKFAGYIQYDGTSIPVQGVSFLVNGREVCNAAGKVTSDHEGKFAFRVLPNKAYSIQAVKDGHTFLQNGYYEEAGKPVPQDHKYEFTSDKTGVYFYDDKRVKLIGRICGGKDQAAIPLGNSLSRNNLGDDLQMVFTLEGDNTSRLVWDIQDRNKKQCDTVFVHKAHDKKYDYQTKVHTTQNRMVVTPDVHTGEYVVELPPVKWKIQQITAKGYPTLFQDGQMSDVIDLSDSLTLHRDTIKGSWKNANMVEVKTAVVEYHAQYNRIYHSPVIIDYKQQGYDSFDYFGDRYYNFKNLDGDKQKLTLAYQAQAGEPVSYTFGHPVFSIDKKYGVKISATEKYYYNNNTKSDTVDVIRLSGGVVTIHNGMVSSLHRDTVQLDSVGEANYVLEAAQTPYLLTGEDALRTVSMTLELDGTHYEAKPLYAYILNIKNKEGAKDILNYATPQLLDILRDPPGGTSKATISKGSTMKYTYQMDMSWKAGATISLGIGTGLNTFTGVVAAPMGAGAVGGFNNGSTNTIGTEINLVWSGSGNRAFNYTMTFNEDISTSSEKTMVGADADLYIGVEQNIVVKPATAIRAIPDSVYVQMDAQLKSGRTVEIAQGLDDQGKLLHLVRDEVVTYGPVLNSTFVHSQQYLINQLIPSLAEQCMSLLFTGTEAEAQTLANTTGEPVYLSTVPKDHADFGVAHKVIVPAGVDSASVVDEVNRYHNLMLQWVAMISQNEREKLSANDLVKNFDIDGGGTLNYAESFSSDYSYVNSLVNPFESITTKYFDNDSENKGYSVLAILGPIASKLLGSVLKGSAGKVEGKKGAGEAEVEIKVVGFTFKFGLVPSLSFNVVPKTTQATSYSRKESFTIGMDKKSHLDFDVYRVTPASEGLSGYGVHDVFVGNNFYEQADYNYDYLKRELDLKNYVTPRSFVYRTRGGATCRPWENERKTNFYDSGTVLDERTKKIENPVIKMDRQSISGVPFGEPARFKLYLTNESEQPEAAYSYFDLYQVETSNPDGAKMMIDGVPLTGNMRTIEVRPGQVTEKTLEVYASEKFDYEGLKIGMVSLGDVNVNQVVAFDVHYLQTAGAVAITIPGDKWVMNCDAPQEQGKGWYMPVVISGFDKNQHNFDHIEFQYKESARGDDYWTNLCGYYADSTIYATASGTKAMIPENGNITTRFFGEGTVIEKAYDLRAVLFCRNGNSFLTNASEVLSGVKDTRRPQLFGNPEPKDAVLGAGDNIIFNFSEDIEYNYLQETTNFEVKGETNEANIQEAPSLQFGGKGYARSEARRNFADKSVTMEVMIKPDDTNREMPIFSHGSDGKRLQLWLTNDKRLKAVVDDKVLESKTAIDFKGFKRVALVLDNEKQTLMLFSDNQDAIMDSVTYSGYGQLTFGAANLDDSPNISFYEGRMLQGRVWNRALDLNTLNAYGNKLLTGYEMGLTDYYPMNEGKGNYANDLAQGADLMLNGAAWALPNGMSLKLDKNEEPKDNKKLKGVQLKSDFFTSYDDEKDYTLMFWFKTSDENGTLFCNGSGHSTDEAALHKFFIGFEGNTLKYRTNGHEYALGDDLNDDGWHHYAMTVNRMRQVANIYIDNDLKAQFSTDSLGGMKGTGFYLGNMVWVDADDNSTVHEANALTGNIDGIALFRQALPITLIKRYSAKSPSGKEKGLDIYVDFDQQERQKNGDITLMPYVLSKVVKFGEDGKDTGKRDMVFADSADVIMNRIDRNIGAPMQIHEELRNLNFSYVGRNNQLLVNIDELDKRINKRTIYVTVADIPDKNGNFMASPQTESFFVDRNPLIWGSQRFTETLQAGVEHKIQLYIINSSGTSHNYIIENLPRWMSVSKTSNIVEPLSSDEVIITVSKDVNVGTYDHIIYLTDENGLSEPLPIELTIEGKEPVWTVDQKLKRYSMNVVGQVLVGGTIVTDSRDKVAVFDADNRCMGCSNVKYDPGTGRSMIYLTVYDSTTVATPLFFRLWHYTTGKTMQLTTSQEIRFGDQSIIGSVNKPVKMNADDLYLQKIDLKEGWNWVSFNVYNAALRRVSQVLNMFPWREGDIVTEDSEDLTLAYKNGKWMSNTSKDINKVSLSQEYCYRVKVQEDQEIEIWGTSLKDSDRRTINVKQGWNSIGYTPMVNLPTGTALTEYFDEATNGDVIKNQHEFAMFASDGKGGGEWLGSLEYMKPGEGYMLYRQKAGSGKFRYPYYEPGATFIDTSSSRAERRAALHFATTMNIVAQAVDIELEEGDRLVAYAGGEMVGEAVMTGGGADDSPSSILHPQLFYLSIEGEQAAPLSFAIERPRVSSGTPGRDSEIIATTDQVMTYQANGISGTPGEPTKISFVRVDQKPSHGWYTVQGIKLDKQPRRSGVYIYNGKKQVIK